MALGTPCPSLQKRNSEVSIRLVQKYLQFCIAELCHLILEYFLKCGYLIYQFNAHFSVYLFFFFFVNGLLLAIYFILIFDYGNDFRQKASLSDFLI